MSVTVVEHPLVAHKLAVLRDESTPTWMFRRMVRELADIVGVAATAHVATTAHEVTTPVARMRAATLTQPGPLIVPILRAGVAMLDSFLKLVPTSEVGFFGTKRDETTLVPAVYMDRMPADLTGRQVIIIDPMLATGGSLVMTIEHVAARGATDITCACLVSAPDGVRAIEAAFERFATANGVTGRLFVAVIDEELNDKGYIVPGLGDAGDRLFGAY